MPQETSALARRAFAKEALEDFEASLASLFESHTRFPLVSHVPFPPCVTRPISPL